MYLLFRFPENPKWQGWRSRIVPLDVFLMPQRSPAYASQTHYVRVHMAELRKKVEDNPSRPKLLVTEPGVGYRLRDRS
jgi:DNA-binding response OmpR family regulator